MTVASMAPAWASRRHALRPAPEMIAAAVTAAAAAASFLSDHCGASVMLFALLPGMAMNSLVSEGMRASDKEFAARTVLRIAVALLGLRITASQAAVLA